MNWWPISDVQEKCLKYFRRDEAKSVQAAALTPLIVLLESNMALIKPVNFSVDWGLASMLMVEFRKAKTNGTCTCRTSASLYFKTA